MNLKPVRHYKIPIYPAKKIIFDNPDILKIAPKRWANNASIQIALSSLLLMTLTACGPKYTDRVKTGNPENTVGAPVNTGVSETDNEVKSSNNENGYVSPIFEHGGGSGSFGCDSVAPPAFLSEEEAYQVISDETRKRGINLEKKNEILKNVMLPVTNTFPQEFTLDPNNPDKTITKSQSKTQKNGDLELDGYDENKKIAFEFVSVSDFKGWTGDSDVWCSVESYNCLEASKILREGIMDKTDNKYIGVFYDPIARISIDNLQNIDSPDKGTELSKELLRQQVNDFLEWLQSQNVI
ncbi:MAG: hypothetical protein BWY74_03850 [Firmicutes bacterium ADurb.Bin419]|nr:MAG: hypothetical protein BWY74_03850 [Firmicutes bacterium ADurb.Bin419]